MVQTHVGHFRVVTFSNMCLNLAARTQPITEVQSKLAAAMCCMSMFLCISTGRVFGVAWRQLQALSAPPLPPYRFQMWQPAGKTLIIACQEILVAASSRVDHPRFFAWLLCFNADIWWDCVAAIRNVGFGAASEDESCCWRAASGCSRHCQWKFFFVNKRMLLRATVQRCAFQTACHPARVCNQPEQCSEHAWHLVCGGQPPQLELGCEQQETAAIALNDILIYQLHGKQTEYCARHLGCLQDTSEPS